MTRVLLRCSAALLSLLIWSSDAGAEELACKFRDHVRESCGALGCVTDNPDDFSGAPGHCAPCANDVHCDIGKCDQSSGTCVATYTPPTTPEPVWPHFNILTADVTFNLGGGGSNNPIVGAGYVFQGAMRSVTPTKMPDGHWHYADLPRWYWSLGGSFAMAGSQQNVFANGGVAWYQPANPFYLTTVEGGFLYQRQGSSVWSFENDTNNTDRIGPAITFGFLQNVFVRGAYEVSVRGPDSGGWLLSIIYAKDLESDIVPDRFKRFLK